MKNATHSKERASLPTSLLSFWLRSGGGKCASALTLCLVVAAVIMACGADSKSNTGASSPAPVPSAVVAPSGTPAALRASYLAARQKEGGSAYDFEAAASGGATGRNSTHQLEVGVAGGATSVTRTTDATSPAWHLGLQWTGLGRGSEIAPVPQPKSAAAVAGNRATYVREDDSQEWYENGPLGVEQGFVLPAPPAGPRSEALAIEVSVAGDLAPALASGASKVDLRNASGKAVAHYTDLVAFDATGAELHSWLEVDGGAIRLRVEDSTASYPLAIDPIVWTVQQELTASDDAAGDWFGFSVSVSGSVAIIGAPNHTVSGKAGAGTAYIYLQSGTSWTEQAEISAGDAAAGDGFGSSVSISGTIAIVGAPLHKVGTNTAAGSAYVFSEGVTGWSQQAELTAAGDAAASDNYGTSVAVSVSGSTEAVIVGAPNHASSGLANSGSAYVYVYDETSTTWALQQVANAFTDGATDGAAGDAFGTSVSVSVSATASVAIVGAPYHTAAGSPNEAGAAYVFAQSASTWPYQQELDAPTSGANAGAAFDAFGTSVSIDGATAFVGAPNHAVSGHDEAGSAYVFAQGNTSAWSMSQMLVASDPALGAQFGSSVSVSGTNAIVGSYLHDAVGAADAGVEDEGTAYVFFLCSTWSQQQELQEATGASFTTPAPSDFFGYSVSISGANALVGAYGAMVGTNVSAGASYVFDGTGCCIGGSVYNSGATNPTESCEVCTPATSTTAWSDEPTGTSCDGGECSSGLCVAAGVDAGSSDAGSGEHDAGAADAGSGEHDAGAADAGGGGEHDAGAPIDSGTADSGTSGTGGNDASAPVDSGTADGAAPTDASTSEDAGPVSSEDSGTPSSEDSGSSVGEDGGAEDSGFVVGSEDSGVSSSEDASTGTGDGGSGNVGEGGGCGCTVVGSTHDTHALFGAVGLVLVAARRRRRRQAARAHAHAHTNG
jgi:MYXO-CTERM domain-containing protein